MPSSPTIYQLLKLKVIACVTLLMLAISGCASSVTALPVAQVCPEPPMVPAWVMEPPSSSVQLLDALILVSEKD